VLTPAEEEESVSDETLLDVPSEQDEILVDAQLPSNVRAEDDISTTTTLKPALAVGVLVTALCVSLLRWWWWLSLSYPWRWPL
jgi:hypothetical protein